MGNLLLHGFTLAPSLWKGVAAGTSPFLPGHGAEPPIPWESAIDGLIAGLEPDTHIVGYSMGGRLGWGLLARADPRITRATLVGAHPGLSGRAERHERRARDAEWASLLEREGLEPFLAAWERLPLFAGQTPSQRARAREMRRGHDPRGLAQALRLLGLAEMPPLERAIEIPVTLVVGENDAPHRLLAHRALALLPRGRLGVVPGAGHDVVLERPRAIRALLDPTESKVA